MNSNFEKKYSEVYVAWKAIIGQKQIDWTGFENTDQAVQFLYDQYNIIASGIQLKAFRQAFQAYHNAVERHIASSIKDKDRSNRQFLTRHYHTVSENCDKNSEKPCDKIYHTCDKELK